MILNLWDKLNQFADKVNQFIANHSDNYLFWIAICAVLLAIGIMAISKLSDK